MKTKIYYFPDCEETKTIEGKKVQCILRRGHGGNHEGYIQWEKSLNKDSKSTPTKIREKSHVALR